MTHARKIPSRAARARRPRLMTVLMLLVSPLLAHCPSAGPGRSGGGGFGGSGGGMRATIDGVPWEAAINVPGVPEGVASPVGAGLQRDPRGGGDYLSITGTRTDGTTGGDAIGLGLYSADGFPLGTYALADDGADASAGLQLEWNNGTYNAVSGAVELTAYDGRTASGRFEAVVEDAGERIEIEGGRFEATLLDAR